MNLLARRVQTAVREHGDEMQLPAMHRVLRRCSTVHMGGSVRVQGGALVACIGEGAGGAVVACTMPHQGHGGGRHSRRRSRASRSCSEPRAALARLWPRGSARAWPPACAFFETPPHAHQLDVLSGSGQQLPRTRPVPVPRPFWACGKTRFSALRWLQEDLASLVPPPCLSQCCWRPHEQLHRRRACQ